MIYAFVFALILQLWAIEGSRDYVAPLNGEHTNRAASLKMNRSDVGPFQEERRSASLKMNHRNLGSSRVKREALLKPAVFPVTVNLAKFKNEIDNRMNKLSERITDNTDDISSNRETIRNVESYCEREIEKLRGEMSKRSNEIGKINWIDIDDSYTEIGSSLFKVFPDPVDWVTAKVNCEWTKVKAKVMGITMKAKGHLAYDKDDKIHEYLKNKQETMAGGKSRIWLGSTDVDDQGVWKWGDGTEVDAPGHWNDYSDNPGENGPKVEVQDCMCIGWATSDNWDEQSCERKLLYACQFDLSM